MDRLPLSGYSRAQLSVDSCYALYNEGFHPAASVFSPSTRHLRAGSWDSQDIPVDTACSRTFDCRGEASSKI